MKKLVSSMVEKLKSDNVIKKISIAILGINFAVFLGTSGYLIFNIISHSVKQKKLEQTQKLCNAAYEQLCVKAASCTDLITVESCDRFVEEEKLCGEQIDYPSDSLIEECTDKVRLLSCHDDLPASCLTFMK